VNVPKLYPVADPPLVNTKDVQAAIETLSRVVAAQATAINRLNNWAGLVKVSGGDKTPEWLANTLVTPEGVTYETQGGTTPNLIVGDGADERVTMNPGLVTASDTTVKWLWDQLHAGDNIVLTLLNEGASEEVKIASTGGGSVVHLCTTPEWSFTYGSSGACIDIGTTYLNVQEQFPTHLAGILPDALFVRIRVAPAADICASNAELGLTRAGNIDLDLAVSPTHQTTSPAGLDSHVHGIPRRNLLGCGLVRVNPAWWPLAGMPAAVSIINNTGFMVDLSILLVGWITGATWSVPY